MVRSIFSNPLIPWTYLERVRKVLGRKSAGGRPVWVRVCVNACETSPGHEGRRLSCHRTRSLYIHIEGRGPSVRRSAMKVKKAMHKGIECSVPTPPIIEIAKLMRRHDVGAIPIGENDRLIGMVTDRDIVCKGLAEDGFDARGAPAR